MATAIARNRLLADEQDIALARQALESLEGPRGYLALGQGDSATEPLPRALGVLIQDVLRAVASGSTTTIVTTPSVVTTSTAAAMLGISRPTLMKMIRDGGLRSHKVGSHTRLRSDDVIEVKRARRERERAAFGALLQVEEDE